MRAIINISLPEPMAALIETAVASGKYSTKSEFFRSLLRLVIHNETIIEQASTFPFIEPKSMSASQVMNAFKNTGSYSNEFLEDLEEGLSQSTSFSK